MSKTIDEIIEDVMIPTNTYLIIFKDECLQPMRVEIDKNINRLNNPSDDEIIQGYVSFNYGSVEFEFIPSSEVEYIRIR